MLEKITHKVNKLDFFVNYFKTISVFCMFYNCIVQKKLFLAENLNPEKATKSQLIKFF